MIDQEDFSKAKDKTSYIMERLGVKEQLEVESLTGGEEISTTKTEYKENKGYNGRKIKRTSK